MSAFSRGLAAACGHSGTVHLVSGRLACGRCDAFVEHDGADGDTFNSDSPPSGVSRRCFAEWCRSGRVAGATKMGPSGPWICTRHAWDAARIERRPATAPDAPRTAAANDIAGWIRAAGLRPTRMA